MTDVRSDRRAASGRLSDKRERLTEAAVRLVYQQGVEATTLADIAKSAGTPVGGVYYYFKTKDDVVSAVVDSHARQISTTLARIEADHPSPKERLKALVDMFVAEGETIARFGCPLGTLCAELDKHDDVPSLAADLMRLPIAWAEQQYRALGRDDAYNLALDLMAAYEGSALLAATLHDPELLAGAAARIRDGIDAL